MNFLVTITLFTITLFITGGQTREIHKRSLFSWKKEPAADAETPIVSADPETPALPNYLPLLKVHKYNGIQINPVEGPPLFFNAPLTSQTSNFDSSQLAFISKISDTLPEVQTVQDFDFTDVLPYVDLIPDDSVERLKFYADTKKPPEKSKILKIIAFIKFLKEKKLKPFKVAAKIGSKLVHKKKEKLEKGKAWLLGSASTGSVPSLPIAPLPIFPSPIASPPSDVPSSAYNFPYHSYENQEFGTKGELVSSIPCVPQPGKGPLPCVPSYSQAKPYQYGGETPANTYLVNSNDKPYQYGGETPVNTYAAHSDSTPYHYGGQAPANTYIANSDAKPYSYGGERSANTYVANSDSKPYEYPQQEYSTNKEAKPYYGGETPANTYSTNNDASLQEFAFGVPFVKNYSSNAPSYQYKNGEYNSPYGSYSGTAPAPSSQYNENDEITKHINPRFGSPFAPVANAQPNFVQYQYQYPVAEKSTFYQTPANTDLLQSGSEHLEQSHEQLKVASKEESIASAVVENSKPRAEAIQSSNSEELKNNDFNSIAPQLPKTVSSKRTVLHRLAKPTFPADVSQSVEQVRGNESNPVPSSGNSTVTSAA